MDGEGDTDWYFEKGINEQSLITVIRMDTEFELRLFWNEIKISDFSALFFFSICLALKTWFELSRVKLFRNDLKGNKNYFELAGGSSYRV